MLKQGTSTTIYKFDKTSHQFLGNGLKREEFDNSKIEEKTPHTSNIFSLLISSYLSRDKQNRQGII